MAPVKKPPVKPKATQVVAANGGCASCVVDGVRYGLSQTPLAVPVNVAVALSDRGKAKIV